MLKRNLKNRPQQAERVEKSMAVLCSSACVTVTLSLTHVFEMISEQKDEEYK